jgi:hypothetical protein
MSRKDKRVKAQRRVAPSQRGNSSPYLLWGAGAVASLVLIGIISFLFYTNGRPAPAATPDNPTPSSTNAPLPTRQLVTGPADYCRRQPGFATTLGFSQQALIGTGQEAGPKGLALFEMGKDGQPSRTYQDPTWDDAGWLGYITLDREGNVFVFPAPRENLVDNPPEKANIVYRVDSTTAQMSGFITVTAAAPSSPENPYGILGMTLDCDTDSLYVTTVAGSTRASEAGKLVQVKMVGPTVAAELPGVDAFGVAVYNWPEGKRLYYGLARTADIYSVALDEAGNFSGQPQYEFSLPDPNFKAWRMRFAQNGDLQVRALEFDFNLKATSERHELAGTFRRDPQTGNWTEVSQG